MPAGVPSQYPIRRTLASSRQIIDYNRYADTGDGVSHRRFILALKETFRPMPNAPKYYILLSRVCFFLFLVLCAWAQNFVWDYSFGAIFVPNLRERT